MKTTRSLFATLATLGAGATLLVGCADAAPAAQSPVAGKEVPAAAESAMPAAPAAATPAAAAMPAAAAATPAAPAAAAGAVKAAAKPMPAKIKNSKRMANKSAEGCCGEGTCAPC
jgi:nucleoid-associated protein YgaU